MDKKKKLLFVIPSLMGGGAERTAVTLLNNLDTDKYELHLALVSSKRGVFLTGLSKQVALHDLKAGRVRYSFISLFRLIHRIHPDTIISFQGHLNLLLILIKPLLSCKTKIVVRESTIASFNLQRKKNWIYWKWLYQLFYPKADCIICQSDAMLNDLSAEFRIPIQKMVRVYNPIDREIIQSGLKKTVNPFPNPEKINVLSIGNLYRVKGFDLLIHEFHTALRNNPDMMLWILGTGPLQEKLTQQRDKLGLNDKIYFPGFQENPYSWLKHADIFILCSLYEGLPNVLLEAMACGCPVRVVEHPGGSGEIMKLTGNIHNWVKWENLFSGVSKRSGDCKYDLSDFYVGKIISQYEKVF